MLGVYRVGSLKTVHVAIKLGRTVIEWNRSASNLCWC